MWGASLIFALMDTKLPGPGAIYLEQTLRFRHPVTVGDTITVSVTAARMSGIASPLAGQADILVVPGLESGNLLARQPCGHVAGDRAVVEP